uniref:Uncharacterized protein n=1 Tax=Sus scrofa TaxID=9823 RepID=A0A8D1EG74_PIG
MLVAMLRDPPRVVGMEQKMRRPLLSRVHLKGSHRSGLLRQVHPPRRPTPVKCMFQS